MIPRVPARGTALPARPGQFTMGASTGAPERGSTSSPGGQSGRFAGAQQGRDGASIRSTMAPSRRRLKPVVACVAIAFLLAACGSTLTTVPQSIKRTSATTSTSTTTTTTLPPTTSAGPQASTPIAGACPPGCSLPSDHDAIAWLASASTSVSIVTAYPNPQPTSEVPTLFKVDRALEITGSPWRPIPAGPFPFPALTPGRQFLVFSSTWRGGLCVSTLYSYDPNSRKATLLAAGRHEIPLPGRDLPVPRTVTLAEVQERMYPTGPFVQSTDVSESMCPE